jgi:hypothetical protein
MISEITTLIAAAEFDVRLLTLLFGVGSFIGGIALIVAHRRGLDRATAEAETARNERFEVRKFKRRSLVGSLIASMGVTMAGLYWVTTPRLFSLFLLMILGLLSGILIIAMIDFFSVSLHTLTDTRADDHKTLLNEYQRRKREHEAQPLGPGEE